jgi:D-3-phosphoglycerate dehydrogenase
MSRLVISTSSFDLNGNPTVQRLIRAGMQIAQNSHGRKLTEDEAIALIGTETVGMIAGIEPLTERVLASAKNLKVISRCGTGTDNVDLAAASRYGITVLNTPEAPAQAVAELTLGLMLAVLRQIRQTDRRLRDGEWPRTQGRLLAAQCVGIVGLGRVGRRVAQACQAFGSEVLAHDSYVTEAPPGVKLIPLDELLAKADIVSLHLTYDAQTHHLINREVLARMKRGAVIINTARGGLIDETALLDALTSGQLDGVALDVFEQEPYRGPLLKCENAVLTSHVGSLAREARHRMEIEAAENLLLGLSNAGILRDEQTG